MEKLTLKRLLAAIQSDDENVRTDAWQSAGKIAAPAIGPLAKIMVEGKLEVGRAAKRGMWKIVRQAGRPDADEEKKAVVAALIQLLADGHPEAVRREVLWMLSEIGRDEAVDAIREIPDLLKNAELREDARCAVERVPTQYALDTLEEGLEAAPDDFKPAIAQSLRARGVEVPGFPCQKLVPTKQTKVTPVGR